MDRGFTMILAAPIVFIAMCVCMLVYTVQQEDKLLDEYVLAYAVDYSTDAAVAEMLNVSHLGQDYTDKKKWNTDPDVALSAFVDFMCMNYDLPMTSSARSQIEYEYIPMFCVAAYDGYYVYTPLMDPEGGMYLQGSLKMPYTYVVDDKYYALNLGAENALKFHQGSLSRVLLKDENISEAEVFKQINTGISDDLMYRFQAETGRDNEFVYLPSDMTTIKKVNPIKGPSVLAFIDKWDIGSDHKLTSFSIGGARVEQTRMVAGYEVVNADGSCTKFYAYSDLLPAGSPVADMFVSVEEAARAGYYYDPVYM